MNNYSIGQTAKLSGLSAKTIRFYEDEGVVEKTKRSENGYRRYDERAVEELKLIKYAREMGLPLSEIKKLMKGCDNGHCEHSKEYVNKNIDEYLKKLTVELKQLNLLKTKLTELKDNLKNSECQNGEYCCDLFHQLLVDRGSFAKASAPEGGENKNV